jgi:hypothetical protein
VNICKAKQIGRSAELANIGPENGNPFLNCRFSVDGRSSGSDVVENNDSVVLQNESAEAFSDAAPDIPYRALSDEPAADERDASPFERTTEVNDAKARESGCSTSTLASDAAEDGDFELMAEAFVPRESETENLGGQVGVGAAVAFGSGNGESRADFGATTSVEAENFKPERESEATALESEDAGDDGDDSGDVEASSLEKYKRSRFIPVDELELDALPPKSEKRFFLWAAQILLTFAVLGGLVALLWRAVQTPTADRLFARIESELNVPDSDFSSALRRTEKDLRLMVELYPNDPRSDAANEWLERLEIEATENRLERRLARRRRGAPSSPIERAYLDALRVAETDPEEGVVKLTAFVELFADEAAKEKARQASEQTSADAEKNATRTQAIVAVATR